MHTLYLLRHAKSSWANETLADHERPLTARGVRDAKRIAKHMRLLAAQPDIVLCSSAVRTRQTLEVIHVAGSDGRVEIEDGLYEASAHTLLKRLREIRAPVDVVLLIGHNPGLHDLASHLATTGPELHDLRANFPTGALATLAVPTAAWSDLREGGATLISYIVPKRLGRHS
jgi:phosphohistidine phosphatase